LDVGEFFQNCNEEVGMDLANQGIGLSYYNELPKGIAIIADPEQLTRVVHNIVGNAVKYQKPEGGLLLSMRLRDAGDYVQVEIEDNGRGISKEDLPHIFDRLYRGDKSRNTKIKGSGIGLSIVKKIISDHGGQIWATSKLGEGSVFYFVLRKYIETENAGGEA
jgi:signal transduction histidine kinase